MLKINRRLSVSLLRKEGLSMEKSRNKIPHLRPKKRIDGKTGEERGREGRGRDERERRKKEYLLLIEGQEVTRGPESQ